MNMHAISKCGCGEVKHKVEIFACEYCTDDCCGDCMFDCTECRRIVCRRCSGKKVMHLCFWCEFDALNKLDIDRKTIKNDVYLMVDGLEYPISNANGNAQILIDATDPIVGDRKYLDIKGLGVLIYKYRSVITQKKSKSGGYAYYLYCEQWRDSTV